MPTLPRSVTVSTEVDVDIDLLDMLEDLDGDDLLAVLTYCKKCLANVNGEAVIDPDMFWHSIHQACLTDDTATLHELLRGRLWQEIGRAY